MVLLLTNIYISAILFIPLFIVLLVLRHFFGSPGMADVVAIPFTMFSLAQMFDLSLIFFPFTLFASMKIYPKTNGKIRFIPVLFTAFGYAVMLNYIIQNLLGFC